MKKGIPILIFLFFLLLATGTVLNARTAERIEPADTVLNKKELRKARKKEARKEIKQHFTINVTTTYAFLETQLQFTTPQGLLSFQLGLEKNLGLEDNSWIVSTNFIYRITPRSGLFAMYYGLKRKSTFTVKEDLIFPGDTIKAGSFVAPFFNTNVISFGYLLSILHSEKSFLGVFFNLYMMDIRTGIETNINTKRNLNYKFVAPLPNFGLIMDFKFAEWFHLYGGFGIFFVNNIDGVGGSVYDMQIYANFQPAKWLGLSIGYQGFSVNVSNFVDNYKMDITYNFRGPSAGLSFKF